jgi:hypothetical protein
VWLLLRTHIIFLRNVRRLLVTANVFPRSSILVTLVMEAVRSSKTSALTRATRRNLPEDDILENNSEFVRFTTRLNLTVDGDESFIQLHHYCRVYPLPWSRSCSPLLR